jgi:hypothetical protein
MPEAQGIITNFTAGEFSPRLLGRTDLSKYQNALKTQLNLITQKHGGVIRRSRTRFVREAKDSQALVDRKARMIPFQFSTQQTYALEFGELYIRFYRDKARLQHGAIETVTDATWAASVATITLGSHSVQPGDEISVQGILTDSATYQLGFNGTFTVTAITATTIDYALTEDPLNGGADAYASGGTVTPTSGVIATEIVTPYAASDLPKLKWTQSADILYLAHPDYEPRLLKRTAGADADPAIWSLDEFNPENGPYLAINTDETATLTIPAGGGLKGDTLTITIDAEAVALINAGEGFLAGDVGRALTWKTTGDWGWGTISVRNSRTSVDVVIGSPAANEGTTDQWAVGAWSTTNGWPFCVVFHEDRLWWGGTPLEPQTLFGSVVGDYDNYTPFDPNGGLVRADDGIRVTINDDAVNTIHWLKSEPEGSRGNGGVIVMTNGGIFIAESVSDDPIQFDTINVRRRIKDNSSELAAPQQIGGATLIVSGSNRRVHEFVFRPDLARFFAPDLTILAEHITLTGIVETALQTEPDNILWALRTDGSLAAMTYEREEEVVGWHLHQIGGTVAGETQSQVESITVIRDGNDDLLWMVVKRTINGVTRRYVEFIERLFADDDTVEEALFADSGLTLDSSKAITGATAADPVVLTVVGHGFSSGDRIRVRAVKGMTELNDTTYLMTVLTADTFSLQDIDGVDIDGSAFTAYVSGGQAYKEVQEVSNLGHLVGETVKILADGGTHADKTVAAGGTVSLDRFASLIHVGLAFTYRAVTLPIIPVSRSESRGKTMRTDHAILRFNRSLGGSVGDLNLDDVVTRKPDDPMNEATPLFSGKVRHGVSQRHTLEPTIAVEGDDPLPMNLLSMEIEMGVEGL